MSGGLGHERAHPDIWLLAHLPSAGGRAACGADAVPDSVQRLLPVQALWAAPGVAQLSGDLHCSRALLQGRKGAVSVPLPGADHSCPTLSTSPNCGTQRCHYLEIAFMVHFCVVHPKSLALRHLHQAVRNDDCVTQSPLLLLMHASGESTHCSP